MVFYIMFLDSVLGVVFLPEDEENGRRTKPESRMESGGEEGNP